MRQLLPSLIVLLSSFYSKAQKDAIPVQSKIEKVTVFLKGAQVERNAKQNLIAGKYNIVFEGISPKIDKQSIQLKAEGKLTILSVTHQLNFLKEQQAQDEIKQLENQKNQLLDKINMEKNMQNVYRQEEQLILKNQSIKGDNVTLKASELKEAADFQRQRLTEIYEKLQETDHNLKTLNLDLQKLNNQLSELNQKKDLSTSEIIVAADVKEATSAIFHLSYLVQQSGWFPTYDIRVHDITQPLTLQMKANINQQSGENWKDVKLLLSTGNPNENGTKPTLTPWYLRFYNPIALGQIRPDALQGKVAGVQISNNTNLNEVVVTGYGKSSEPEASSYNKQKREETNINTLTSYQPTTTIFEIKDPYSVPNDGKIYTVEINSYDLNASYEYYAVPKLDANAYLTAQVVDWQELNLLPGEANLFFEGTYLGNSLLDVINAGDTLKLSLGIDKGVVIKRTLLKEYSQKKFLGNNKSDSRQYEITVRNNKQQPVNIIIEDQLPISTDKDIEIEKSSFERGKLDDDTKKITWNLAVDPKKETKLHLAYSVKYAKDKTLQLE